MIEMQGVAASADGSGGVGHERDKPGDPAARAQSLEGCSLPDRAVRREVAMRPDPGSAVPEPVTRARHGAHARRQQQPRGQGTVLAVVYRIL